MNKLIRIIGQAIVGLISTLLVANSVFANEVNVFSARHYDSDVQLYEKFTAKTGIKVNVVSGKDKALQKRIKEEGKDSKADIYITADAGRLGAFQAEGMFQKGASSAAIKKVVPAGEADWAVANTYYLALMLSGKKGAEQQAAAKKVMPFFPNQDGRGTHMNISGGGILKYAPNKANAVKLLEFLLTPEAQQHIVNNTFEYPMIPGVKANKLIAQFGLDFKQDLKTKVSNYGKLQAKALKVMNEAGW